MLLVCCCEHCKLQSIFCVVDIDILSAVNDKSASWVQRVKLVRYAWVSESVILLNKKQTLMNILVSGVSTTQRYCISQCSVHHTEVLYLSSSQFLF